MSEKPTPEFMAAAQMITALMGMTLAYKQRFGDEALEVARGFAEQLGTKVGSQFKERAGVTGVWNPRC